MCEPPLLSCSDTQFCRPRYLYCLQLRQDIKERRVLLDPASDPALQLAALTVQANLGDYDAEQHVEGYTHKYLGFLYGSESAIVRPHALDHMWWPRM